MKKHKSHSKKSKDNIFKSKDRQGSHILIFVVVIIVAFAILSATSDLYPDAEEVDTIYTGNIAGQAWGSVVRSYDGVIVAGHGNAKSQVSDTITRFCSDRYCNHQSCHWGNVKITGPGCLVFAYDVIDAGCAYGIASEGQLITTEPSQIDTIFSSGDAGARSLMNEEWKATRGTYKCENNDWVYQG